ncbi:hypothetical protein EXS71_01740 [Candidatus Uhrbacteria bacterium]|nr:hypothetical protein [Candidatus Uhrbacteria bacterium]
MTHTFWSFAGRMWRSLCVTALLGGCLALLFSLTIPLQYSSSIRVFISQLNANGLDPYTALKSTERIATSLSELVYTTIFYQDVITQSQGFDANYFPADEYAKRKLWKESIVTSVTPGTGIMTVTAFHPNRGQARIMVDAAAKELALQAPNYFGANVRIQVIDSPLNSRWFARPNLLMNGLFGALIGLLFGLIWVVLHMPERRGD